MLWLHAILLGVVEGLTEFLPVSSTGHLILLVDILGFAGPPGRVFEVAVQLGAILAICWLYRTKLLWTAHRLLPGRQGDDESAWHFALSVLLAFLPAAAIGFFAHSFIKEVLFSPLVVAAMLVVGGVLILLIERFKPAPVHHDAGHLPYRTALLIGCVQVLAMVPGTSRSGATIMGALLAKVDRAAAVEFSFFLAIPTMFGAVAYDLYKNWDMLSADGLAVIATGFAAAFVSGLAAVKWLMGFVKHNSFVPFAWYRIALGSAMLLLLR